MANVESGKANRQIVSQVIKDLHDFDEAVTSELDTIKRKTEDLEEAWKDAQYKEFKGFIEDLTLKLKKDLAILQEAREDLERRLKIYEE